MSVALYTNVDARYNKPATVVVLLASFATVDVQSSDFGAEFQREVSMFLEIPIYPFI